MKNGTEIAYTYAQNINIAKQLSDEIDAAIAEAVKAERDRIAEAARTFVDWRDAIPDRRPDDLCIAGIQYLGDNGKVKDINISIGDLRKLAAAIRNQ